MIVLAPAANDASAMAELLQRHGLAAEIARDARHARELIEGGAGAFLLTEESLDLRDAAVIFEALKMQPAWSDLPVIVLTSGGTDRLARLLDATAAVPGKVTLLERPIGAQLLVRSVQVAIGARQRQYQVRRLLAEQERRRIELETTQRALQDAQAQLREYAHGLEQLVADRTAKLRETVEELEAFSYSIAHDMRAPLRSMHGFSEILREEHASALNDEAQNLLRRIGASAHRLDLMIQDVLNYSRIVREELRLEAVDVGELITEVIESYPNLNAVRECLHLDAVLPVLIGNRAALTQVVSNLLGNAVKFVAPDVRPAVRVHAEATEPPPGHSDAARAWVRVMIDDNGVGIDPLVRPKLFQMFQRFAKPGLYEGTGMGLAIARKAVERMGGVIGADSLPGQGSRFWFVLPTAEAGARGAGAKEPERRSRNQRRPSSY